VKGHFQKPSEPIPIFQGNKKETIISSLQTKDAAFLEIIKKLGKGWVKKGAKE